MFNSQDQTIISGRQNFFRDVSTVILDLLLYPSLGRPLRFHRGANPDDAETEADRRQLLVNWGLWVLLGNYVGWPEVEAYESQARLKIFALMPFADGGV
jgi:hypothetical protein